MKNSLLIICVLLFCIGCKTKHSIAKNTSAILPNEYGYTQENPIKVGGVKTSEGPLNEREYLNSLTDLEGNSLSYYRIGSCCRFETPNGAINGKGLLDIYAVYVKGKTDTVKLYLNMYDEDKLLAPRGFKFKM